MLCSDKNTQTLFTDIILKVLGVVSDVDDDLVRLDDLLIGVVYSGVVVADGHPEPLYLHVHHAVGRSQDVDVRNSRAATKVSITRNRK